MEKHDPALCDLAVCQRCDDYTAGYQRGKEKARFEIEVWDGSHAYGCGCEPCRLAKGIISRSTWSIQT